jgi:hypothetical protein
MPHLDVEATIAAILRLRARYPQAIVLIEEAANGFALVAQTEESARDRQRGRGEAVGRQNVEVPGDVPGMGSSRLVRPARFALGRAVLGAIDVLPGG